MVRNHLSQFSSIQLSCKSPKLLISFKFMSANADSVRFKFACNVHDWAYFEKISVSGKTKFLPKIAYGLGQEISCFKFLEVSDFKVIFK